MMFSEYIKLRILYLWTLQYNLPAIAAALEGEGITAPAGVWLSLYSSTLKQVKQRFVQSVQYETNTGTIARQPGSGRETLITAEVKAVVEEQMRRDDETTASQLHVLLVSLGYRLNLRTVLRCRTALGWTFRGSAYCQLIRAVNQQKRLDFARANLSDNFTNVIFTDECSVQLETHCRRCCRKLGEPPKNKPR